MIWVFIGIIICVIGAITYTLDIHFLATIGILIGMILLCTFIGVGISKITAKSKSCASVFSALSIPTIVAGVLLFIVGCNLVYDSEKIVASSSSRAMIESVVTPSSLGLIGVFLVLLGITFVISSSEPSSK